MATILQAGFNVSFFLSYVGLSYGGWFVCSFVLVFFPNSFQIANHTEYDCPLTIISCPYEKMGCESQVS